jgi:hypothetical protein
MKKFKLEFIPSEKQLELLIKLEDAIDRNDEFSVAIIATILERSGLRFETYQEETTSISTEQ